MSLLAEVLSKIKKAQSSKRDVPPHLMDIVSTEKRRGSSFKRLALFGLITVLAVGVGFGTVTLLQTLTASKSVVKPLARGPSPVSPVKETPPPTAVTPSQEKKEPEEVALKNEIPVIPLKEKPSSRETPVEIEPDTSQQTLPQKQTPLAKKQVTADEVDSYIYAGRQYEKEMNYPAAVKEYLNALRLKPKDPYILNALSYLYLRMTLPDRALTYALKAVKIRYNYVPALVNAGISYAEIQEERKAEKKFIRALEFDALNREALYNLGLLYEREERFDESLNVYRRLIHSGDYDAYIHLARVLEKSGREEDAVTVYRSIMNSEIISEDIKREATGRLSILRRR